MLTNILYSGSVLSLQCVWGLGKIRQWAGAELRQCEVRLHRCDGAGAQSAVELAAGAAYSFMPAGAQNVTDEIFLEYCTSLCHELDSTPSRTEQKTVSNFLNIHSSNRGKRSCIERRVEYNKGDDNNKNLPLFPILNRRPGFSEARHSLEDEVDLRKVSNIAMPKSVKRNLFGCRDVIDELHPGPRRQVHQPSCVVTASRKTVGFCGIELFKQFFNRNIPVRTKEELHFFFAQLIRCCRCRSVSLTLARKSGATRSTARTRLARPSQPRPPAPLRPAPRRPARTRTRTAKRKSGLVLSMTSTTRLLRTYGWRRGSSK